MPKSFNQDIGDWHVLMLLICVICLHKGAKAFNQAPTW